MHNVDWIAITMPYQALVVQARPPKLPGRSERRLRRARHARQPGQDVHAPPFKRAPGPTGQRAGIYALIGKHIPAGRVSAPDQDTNMAD
jgi:hypothetical protein